MEPEPEAGTGVAGLEGSARLSTSKSGRGVDLGVDMCVIQGTSYDAQQEEVACQPIERESECKRVVLFASYDMMLVMWVDEGVDCCDGDLCE